jgi:hypothetical protein
MHKIFAVEHQAPREDRSDMETCPEDGRRPHPNIAVKSLGAREAINAFDQPVSLRNPVRSFNASRLAPDAAGGLAVRSDSEEHFFVYNGITYDIGSVLQCDTDNKHLVFRNGIVHDIRNILQVLSGGVWVAENRIREGRADEVPEILGQRGGRQGKCGSTPDSLDFALT